MTTMRTRILPVASLAAALLGASLALAPPDSGAALYASPPSTATAARFTSTAEHTDRVRPTIGERST